MATTRRQRAALTPDEFRGLMRANGVTGADALAVRVGVHRTTAFRWLAGARRVSRFATALILSAGDRCRPGES